MTERTEDRESYWHDLGRDLERRLGRIPDLAKGELRDLVRNASDSVGSGESSLLVPDPEGVSLRFLVSVNASLEESEILVPCDRSIAGYVYATGQTIAVDDFTSVAPSGSVPDQPGPVIASVCSLAPSLIELTTLMTSEKPSSNGTM